MDLQETESSRECDDVGKSHDEASSQQQLIITNSESTNSQLSKRQMKKLAKHQKWLEKLPERRKKEREKRKLKKKLDLLNGSLNGVAKTPLVAMKDSTNSVAIVIDCDFEKYMNDLEMRKLVSQIGRCYSANRHSPSPCQLYITSINGAIRDHFIKTEPGYSNWDANCLQTHWKDIFEDKIRQNQVIYLTGDSENILPDVNTKCVTDEDTGSSSSPLSSIEHPVYIIGGLVDHNRHKSLCLNIAQESNVQHAKLPIDEHIKMIQRRILTVNHVFEIMLLVSNGLTWKDAFNTVIPKRKIDSTITTTAQE